MLILKQEIYFTYALSSECIKLKNSITKETTTSREINSYIYFTWQSFEEFWKEKM